jgi:hypothetical protein
MNKFWKGFLSGVLVTVLFVTAWDLEVYGLTVWRGWSGRIANALHEWHGGEPHTGRRDENDERRIHDQE